VRQNETRGLWRFAANTVLLSKMAHIFVYRILVGSIELLKLSTRTFLIKWLGVFDSDNDFTIKMSSSLDSFNCRDGDRHCLERSVHNLFNRSNSNHVDDDVEIDTTEDCATSTSDASGTYGNATDGSGSGSFNNGTSTTSTDRTQLVVKFQYQIQTSLSFSFAGTLTDNNTSVLSLIEKKISDVLVEDFFNSCATKGSRSNRRRTGKDTTIAVANNLDNAIYLRHMLEGAVESTWEGLNASPEDRVLPGLAGGRLKLCIGIISPVC
jgi:hypothetical protein